MVIPICLFFTAFSIALLIGALFFRKRSREISELMAAIGTGVLIMTLAFGWGVAGTRAPVETKMKEINNVEYIRTSSRLIVETGNGYQGFESIAPYKTENKDLQAFRKIEYNSYGYEIERDIVLKIEGEDRYYGE